MDSWSVTLICISCHVVFLAHNDVHIGAKMADTTNNLISFYLILASANLHNGLTPCILSMVSSNIMQRSTICIHHHTSSISWPYFSRRHLSLSQTKATKAQRSNLQQNDATTKGMIKISNPSSHSSIHPPHRTFYGSSLTRVAPPTRQPRPGRHVGFKVSGLDGGEISTNIGERQDGTSFFLILPSPKLTASPTRKERILL